MKKKILSIAISSLLFSTSFAQVNGVDTTQLHQTDGPYIFYNDEGIKSIRVSDTGLEVTQYENRMKEKPFWVTSDDGLHRFEVKLHQVERANWKYEATEKTLVLSDPHGDLGAFVSILQAQKVINAEYEWTFGANRLMIIGDVFDRGDDVLPIFWLIYKLEAEAAEAGGSVHFLLGNHEEMILKNDVRYANEKYKKLSAKLNKPQNEMWTIDSEIGHWLLTRNTIEIIGDNLFVHAGLSKEFREQNWEIPTLNDTISHYLPMSKEERKESEVGAFLFASKGPLWYRGMVRDDDKYFPLESSELDKILKQYAVERIFVGHTIFDEVSSFYDNKVIAVNVSNRKNMDAQKSRGILINKGEIFKIYDDPSRLEHF